MWPFFSSLPALLLCVPPVCWCASGISLSLSLSFLFLPLCVTLSDNISPPLLPPHPPLFFTLSHFLIGREPRVETAHRARSTLECRLKLCSMCALHVSSRCPTDTHFMLMSCLGSAIRGWSEGETAKEEKRSHSGIVFRPQDETQICFRRGCRTHKDLVPGFGGAV